MYYHTYHQRTNIVYSRTWIGVGREKKSFQQGKDGILKLEIEKMII